MSLMPINNNNQHKNSSRSEFGNSRIRQTGFLHMQYQSIIGRHNHITNNSLVSTTVAFIYTELLVLMSTLYRGKKERIRKET
uniref:Uncharacterized protein n=1 Tax=Arundo donax TaxID=35708 RepID=A0A0A9F118_ARUDO